MKPLVLFHADCADGSAAAFAAWCKFGETAEYRAVAHGDPPPEDVEGRDVYILDFSFAPSLVDRVAMEANRVVVVDHHKTAVEWYRQTWVDRAERSYRQIREGLLPVQRGEILWEPPPNVELVLDLAHSGAVLAWNHFHPGAPVPEVLPYVEDRDLWHWAMPSSREVSAALEARGVREDWRVLCQLHEEPVRRYRLWETERDLLIAEGATLLRAQAQRVAYLVSIAERVTLPGHGAALAVNTPVLQSEVGEALALAARDRGDLPLGVAWYRDGRAGTHRVSLRSVGEVDCSAIARRYGGGGHKNAAGFQCAVLPW